MKKVYICSPLRGDIEANIARARDYCREAILFHNVIPIAPHIYFTEFLDDRVKAERSLGMKGGIELLRYCDELWVFGATHTEGMNEEIKLAKALNIPIFNIANPEGFVRETRLNL